MLRHFVEDQIAPQDARYEVGREGIEVFYVLRGFLEFAVVNTARDQQRASDGRSWVRLALAVVVGLVVIHAGGVAQLAALGGDVAGAVAIGSVPFLLNDLPKLALAALLIRRCIVHAALNTSIGGALIAPRAAIKPLVQTRMTPAASPLAHSIGLNS